MDNAHRTTFDNQLIELNSVDSTNNYAMAQIHAGLASGGQVYFAHHQWAGKGQRGKVWSSERGQNLTISLVLKPSPIPLSDQFLLGAATAIGCLNGVKKYAPEGWTIKWPNDLFWNDRKAAGILIENVVRGKEWLFAVVGVGLNLNQSSFPPDIPHAVSLKQITGHAFDPLTLALELANQIGMQIDVLKTEPLALLETFNQQLYKRGETVKLKKGDLLFETRLKSVNRQGQLLTMDTEERRFDHGEVAFIGAGG
jgi:BirA family biotin operon repressor/biotin-[acetyl-CoA-carboxylase] ligase